jgi:P4 family phage/plasmid primase-like protien
MNASKKCFVKWSEITQDNFQTFLKPSHNGFAILTGLKYMVIDFDSKHNPPQEILNCLMENCKAIEKTPGGYHFWFLTDARTAHFTSTADAYWSNKVIKGLDIRAKGGIIYCAPSRYTTEDGDVQSYKWVQGNLSCAAVMPSTILEHLHYGETSDDEAFTFTLTSINGKDKSIVEDDEISVLLNNLSQQRVDNYSDWLSVGMALKNSGYSCESWDEWSKGSAKYKPGECAKKWITFKEKDRPLSKGSLYQWLKEDSYDVFVELQGKNKTLHTNLLTATNASIAEAFYELNPHKYIYSNEDGWYCLQENNTWLATKSKDILSIPNIINMIRQECYNSLTDILHSYNTSKDKDEAIYKLIGDSFKKISNTSFIKGVAAFLQGLYYVKNVEKQFNEKRHLFAFEDCVLDMTTFKTRPIQPDDYITVTAGYTYREASIDEKCVVRGFLAKIFPNECVLEYVLKALATTFEGYNRHEFFHVFTGLGANGKSCLIDLCKVVFGDYFKTLSVSYLTKDDDGKKDRPLPELAAARYARMLVSSEPEERDRFQVSLLKLITGNDEVGFRGMYAQKVEKYVPQFKLWVLANDMPRLSKYDQGIERRMRLIHFPTRFVDCPRNENECLKDITIKDKITNDIAWRYGFLGLLVDAAKTIKDGLKMPEEAQDFTDRYMLENNPVGAWLRKYYTLTNSRMDCIKKSELYNTFIEDTNTIISQKKFSEDIIKCNISEKIVQGVRYYIGLMRKEQINIEDE